MSFAKRFVIVNTANEVFFHEQNKFVKHTEWGTCFKTEAMAKKFLKGMGSKQGLSVVSATVDSVVGWNEYKA